MNNIKKINFSIVGSGWRAEYYLNIAKELPHIFHVESVLCRNEEKGKLLIAKYGVKVNKDLNDFIKKFGGDFAVTAVSRGENLNIALELMNNKIPVLSETPPCEDIEDLKLMISKEEEGGKIQVAEQYHLQPFNGAVIETIKKGLLGEVYHCNVSYAHGYHGISMIRKFMGIGIEDVDIKGEKFPSKIVISRDRYNIPKEEKEVESLQTIATLKFGEKYAIFDFTGHQYWSPIRKNRILVRGTKGEIINENINYYKDFNTPIFSKFRRLDFGIDNNLEGMGNRGIILNEEIIYTNPFYPSRLSDDEIGVATCLAKMKEYLEYGNEFYSIKEAAYDTYIGILIEKLVKSGEKIKGGKFF